MGKTWKGMTEIYSTLSDFKNLIKAVTSLLRGNGIKYRTREHGPWLKIYVAPQAAAKAQKLIEKAKREADRKYLGA